MSVFNEISLGIIRVSSAPKLNIVKTFDTNTGSRASPGSAFGGDATLANNFFNAVDEACSNFETHFCGSACTINLQFGYGTLNNNSIDPSGIAQNAPNGFWTPTYSSWLSALQSKATSSGALSFYNAYIAKYGSTTNPFNVGGSGSNDYTLQFPHAYGVWMGGIANNSPDGRIGIQTQAAEGVTYTWTQGGGTITGADVVGILMHEMRELLGGTAIGLTPIPPVGLSGPLFLGNFTRYSASNTFSTTLTGTNYVSLDFGATNLFGSGHTLQTSNDPFDLEISTYGGATTTDIAAGAQVDTLMPLSTAEKQWFDAMGWQWNGT